MTWERRSALEQAIAALARVEVPEVVEKARAQALTQAREQLAEAMTHALLDQAPAHLAPDAEEPPSLRPPRQMPSTERPRPEEPAAVAPIDHGLAAIDHGRAQLDHGLYLYGVVDAGVEVPPIAGIDGEHPLELIEEGEIGAVVSAVPLETFGEQALAERLEDLGWVEQAARAHESTLEQIQDIATIVPMRLCTIYLGEEPVREMLASRAEMLEGALERLAGRAEWGVKVFLERRDRAATRGASEATRQLEAQVAGAGPGESYMLGRRLADMREQESRRVLDERCEDLHLRLAACAVEARLNKPQSRELTQRDAEMLLNAAYLVEDGAQQRFAATVGALREQSEDAGLGVELTGPWPAYNFVEDLSERGSR